jgi:hypothetical protein
MTTTFSSQLFSMEDIENVAQKCMNNFGLPNQLYIPIIFSPEQRAIVNLFDFLEKLGLHPWDKDYKHYE